MSYTPTKWEPDDIVTATRMNTLETAVGEMNMSYTPNTWVDGDVLTAAKMNALEQAVASGGGGGDFSTAQVTFITNQSGHYAIIYGAIFDISSQTSYPTPLTAIATADVEIANDDVYTVALYNGYAYVTMQEDNITVSGNATAEEYIPEYTAWLITITGDCTITIS